MTTKSNPADEAWRKYARKNNYNPEYNSHLRMPFMSGYKAAMKTKKTKVKK